MKFAAASLLVTLSLLAQSLAAQNPPAPQSALDKATLEAYLRYSELWIPQVTVKIDDPKPSAAISGFFDVGVHLIYNGATKDDMYYVSKDGRNVVKGTAYDIAKSPFQSNLDLLKTDQQPAYGAAAGAPVTLVVFSDFQCPFCQKEEQELRKNIPAAFGDKVRVYFADFPLTQIHPWAMKGSIAGRCAFRSSEAAFWDYHDWIYQNQKDVTLENFDSKFQEYARQKGLDMVQLGRCLDDKNAAAEVEKAVKQGHDLQVSATPTLFLNGRRLEGGVDWAVLEQLLQIEIEHKAAEVKTTALTVPAKAAAKEDDSCCTVNIPILGGTAKK
jgi:protein-disulfide isomerase